MGREFSSEHFGHIALNLETNLLQLSFNTAHCLSKAML